MIKEAVTGLGGTLLGLVFAVGDTVDVSTGVSGGILGGILAVGGMYAKIVQMRNAHTLELQKLQSAKEQTASQHEHEDRVHQSEREMEAFKELKQILKDRTSDMTKQTARLDRMEAAHALCEKKFDELRQESIADKVKLALLENKFTELERQLAAVKTHQI